MLLFFFACIILSVLILLSFFFSFLKIEFAFVSHILESVVEGSFYFVFQAISLLRKLVLFYVTFC